MLRYIGTFLILCLFGIRLVVAQELEENPEVDEEVGEDTEYSIPIDPPAALNGRDGEPLPSEPPSSPTLPGDAAQTTISYRQFMSLKSLRSVPQDLGSSASVLNLPKPLPNPGPQRDIAITRIVSVPSLAALASEVPTLTVDRSADQPCRLDLRGRCENLPRLFVLRVRRELDTAGKGLDARAQAQRYYLSRLSSDDRYLLSRETYFGDGELSILNAVIDGEARIEKIFEIPISRSYHGIDLGIESGRIAVLSATMGGDGAYLTIDGPWRCQDRPRQAGILVKTDRNFSRVVWVSPFNVSDTNVILHEDRVYSTSGGSCEKDYLYEIDTASGRVTARNVLPKAADFLAATGAGLIVQLYDSVEAYRFR